MKEKNNFRPIRKMIRFGLDKAREEGEDSGASLEEINRVLKDVELRFKHNLLDNKGISVSDYDKWEKGGEMGRHYFNMVKNVVQEFKKNEVKETDDDAFFAMKAVERLLSEWETRIKDKGF